MPLEDAPQLRLKDRIFRGLFTLTGREPQTFSLLHRLLLGAVHLVLWDGEKSVWARGDSEGRVVLAPVIQEVAVSPESTVLLTDGFEGAFGWEVEGTGADYEAEPRVEAAFHGDYGLYLRTRLTDPAADDYVRARRRFGFLSTRKVLYSFRFNPTDVGSTKKVTFIFAMWDETGSYEAGIQWDSPSGTWQYLGSDGNWHTVPGILHMLQFTWWYPLSLEIDGINHRYGKLRFYGEEIDMSGLEFERWAPGTLGRCLRLNVEITASDAGRPRLYIDDVLVREIV